MEVDINKLGESQVELYKLSVGTRMVGVGIVLCQSCWTQKFLISSGGTQGCPERDVVSSM